MSDIILIAIGMIVTLILVPLFLKYFPASKFDKWGYSHGVKVTTAGNLFKYTSGFYEEIERTLFGSVWAYVQGFQRGLDSDEGKGKQG